MENLHNFKLEQLTVLQTITTRKSLINNQPGIFKYRVSGVGGNLVFELVAITETPTSGPVFFIALDRIDFNIVVEIQNPDGSLVKEDPITPQPYPGNPHRPEYSEEGNRPLADPEEVKKCQKPPVGLMPRVIWETQRIAAIMEALERYKNAGKDPNPDWVAELRELAAKHYPETPAARAKLLNLIGGF